LLSTLAGSRDNFTGGLRIHSTYQEELVQFSADGTTVIAGMLKDQGKVNPFAISWNGEQVLTGGRRRMTTQPGKPEERSCLGAAIWWDFKSGQPLGPPLMHGNDMTSVAFCQDGKTAVALSELYTPKIEDSRELVRWELTSGKIVGGPWKMPRKIRRMQVCPDGETVLLDSPEAKEAFVWHLPTARTLGPIPWSESASARMSPDGQFAAVNDLASVTLYRSPEWTSRLPFPCRAGCGRPGVTWESGGVRWLHHGSGSLQRRELRPWVD
jgi:hypothetical protein